MSFLYWGLLLASTAFLSALIILRERDVKWLLYGLAGSVIAGLFFDPLSVHFGYYKFNLPFGSIWGVPFLVILQEALCVIVVIYFFEIAFEKAKKLGLVN